MVGRHFEVPHKKSKQTTLARRLAIPAIAGLALTTLIGDAAAQYSQGRRAPYGYEYGEPRPRREPYRDDYGQPRSNREPKREEAGQPRRAGAPMLAIVSLNDQRVSIYGADGKIMQAPVSTGATGLETPAGIYSVVQKNEVHQSNQYEDGNMPFMQRITWTGIALHAGVLPGHPASHGCVRMPYEFAQRLFGLTDLGMRVIVVRDDIVPAVISHASLFQPDPSRLTASPAPTPTVERLAGGPRGPTRIAAPADTDTNRQLQVLKSIAEAKTAEAQDASKRASEAKAVATRAAAAAAPAIRALRAAESNLVRAEAAAKDAAERPIDPAAPPERIKQAELAKEKTAARLAEAQAQLEAAKLQAEARTDAAARAGELAKAAEIAREAALEAADEATRKTLPVSVFISRKTQRLYVRQNHQPVFEVPVTIRDADKPIGSYVFTALNTDAPEVRWNVVSMYKKGASPGAPPAVKGRTEARHAEPAPSDVDGAKAALDRVVIPKEVIARVSEVVLPGASLIISDEGASIETGKDTDFVVLMSGEPQGGIKTRHREPLKPRNDDFWGGPSSSKGGFPFWFN